MVKVVKSKLKASRSVGANLHDNVKFDGRASLPGIHPTARRSNSGYALQNKEKKKVIHFYAISESFLKRSARQAIASMQNSNDKLVSILETMVSTVLYRSGFVASIFEAKQVVSHGHVSLNNKPINLCKIALKEGDVLTITTKNHPAVTAKLAQSKNQAAPDYLQVNKDTLTITVKSTPKLQNVKYSFPLDIQSIIEFYSL
jgi:small subunit ribosomal protein S4